MSDKLFGFKCVTDPTMPPDEISFRDAQGRELGRMVNIVATVTNSQPGYVGPPRAKPEQGDGR